MDAETVVPEPWEITFTGGFREDLTRVSKEVVRHIDRTLDFLRANPFDRIPNAAALRGGPHRFRARIAGHFRLLYQVFSKVSKCIEI